MFIFNQLYMWHFRSVVLDIRSVKCPFSISCTCDFFDQFCWVFDQSNVHFQSVVHVTFSISCARYLISWTWVEGSFFDQLCKRLSREISCLITFCTFVLFPCHHFVWFRNRKTGQLSIWRPALSLQSRRLKSQHVNVYLNAPLTRSSSSSTRSS